MTESNRDIKVVFDEYTIKKTDFGFNITLISDAIDVVTFNKKTQMVKHMNMLDNILGWRMRFTDAKSDRKDKFAKEYIDFAAALERSDYVIVYNDDAVENFVRRYIAIMRPLICEQAPVVIDRIPHKLVKYLDKLDIIEKVMIETSPANLAYQLEKSGCQDRADLPFQKAILNEELPYTIGGGIGQSRICMFFLRKAHIGEVQCSLWPEDLMNEAKNSGLQLL